METFEAITKRVSVRKYGEKPVSREDIEKIVLAGSRAASANNIQPVEFVVVTASEKRKELAAIAPNNGPYMAHSPVVIAVIAKPEKYYLEDGSAATQNILVMARDLGLGSVWVAGDKKDYCEKILKALNVPAGAYRLISLVCVGYPEGNFHVTPKKDIKKIVHWESF